MFSIIKFASSRCLATVRQPIAARMPFLREMSSQSAESAETIKEIQELIKDKIRPTIQEHGGDLEFVSYENKIVRVRLQGACSTCPSSIVTLKNGVRNMLQYYVPEIEDVEEVLDGEP